MKLNVGYSDVVVKCQKCGKSMVKNNPWQILKYCSPDCRKGRLKKKYLTKRKKYDILRASGALVSSLFG